MRRQHLSWDVPVAADPDVLVVGGGSAGIAASVAAARGGATTMLIERYGFLGGTSTAALVGPMMTSFSTEGHQPVVGGIFQELVGRMVAMGGAVDPGTIPEIGWYGGYIKHGHTHVTPFHPEALKMAAQDMVLDAGVQPLLHTTFVDPIRDDGRLCGAVVVNKAGLSVIRANVLIDTSADGDVAAAAGAAFMKGRPEDGKMQPATMFMRVGNVDDEAVNAWVAEHERIHPGERLYECVVQAARARGEWTLPREYLSLYREPEPGVWRINVTRVLGVDGTDPESLTRGEMEGRRQVWWLMQFMIAHCRGFEQARMLEAGTQLGVRETRRITGEYVLTGEDCLEGRRFPDAIARGSYLIDIHDPTGTRTTLTQINAPFYDIPYRCLVPKDVDALLVAGRCISVDHVAFGTTRVIPQCYATGQAAGTAAAMAVRSGAQPRAVDTGRLRTALRAAGGIC